MIGLKSGSVKISHHSKAWRECFGSEEARLRKHLGRARYRLEHIGSTSVEGLSAKPIIDMAMQIPSFKRLPLWIRRLEQAGYAYKGEYGLPGRHFFTYGLPVSHHLHIVTPGSEHWERWLLFRDYLRAHPKAAETYNKTKLALARKYPTDRDAYTRSKTPVINRLLAQARMWSSKHRP